MLTLYSVSIIKGARNIGGLTATVDIPTLSVRSPSQQRLAHKVASMATGWWLAVWGTSGENNIKMYLTALLYVYCWRTTFPVAGRSKAVHAKWLTVFYPQYKYQVHKRAGQRQRMVDPSVFSLFWKAISAVSTITEDPPLGATTGWSGYCSVDEHWTGNGLEHEFNCVESIGCGGGRGWRVGARDEDLWRENYWWAGTNMEGERERRKCRYVSPYVSTFTHRPTDGLQLWRIFVIFRSTMQCDKRRT